MLIVKLNRGGRLSNLLTTAITALLRKKMWWWVASFGKSYHGDLLQFAKKMFSVRLPLMTKFFVMRECDDILSGYLCTVTMVICQQDGIYRFKFLKRFLEISSPISPKRRRPPTYYSSRRHRYWLQRQRQRRVHDHQRHCHRRSMEHCRTT